MKLYVAGAYADRDRVIRWMAEARRHFHEVVHDWVRIIDSVAGHDRDLPTEGARKHALGDIAGIRQAEVFWLLSPPRGYGRGCWVELGIASQIGVPIVVSGETARDTVFTALGRRYLDDERAFQQLTALEDGAFV